jgi:hypothetical protein
MIFPEETRRGAPNYDHPFHPSSSPRATLRFAQDRLEFADRTLLARMTRRPGAEVDLDFVGGDDCALARLSAAYLRPVSPHALAGLRAAAREWIFGDKALAQIRVAQSGISKFEPVELVAHRLSLADSLLKSGVAPRDLIKALDLGCEPIAKGGYNPNEPRVPEGEPTGGRWTSLVGEIAHFVGEVFHDAGDVVHDAGKLTELLARMVRSLAEKYRVDHSMPKDAVQVRFPNGSIIPDPSSPTGALLAPARADFSQLYAEGQATANDKFEAKLTLLENFSQAAVYDFQRDSENTILYTHYTNCSNYGLGVSGGGAGISKEELEKMFAAYAKTFSSNASSKTPVHWLDRGRDDAHDHLWSKRR